MPSYNCHYRRGSAKPTIVRMIELCKIWNTQSEIITSHTLFYLVSKFKMHNFLSKSSCITGFRQEIENDDTCHKEPRYRHKPKFFPYNRFRQSCVSLAATRNQLKDDPMCSSHRRRRTRTEPKCLIILPPEMSETRELRGSKTEFLKTLNTNTNTKYDSCICLGS